MEHTRILIVDDSPTVCELLARGLSEKGYQTLQAVRMEEALSYGGSLVDLILTDIIMPGMDGYAGIARIKANWPDVPVIAMSAGAGEDARDGTLLKARNMGADAILQKPFSIEALDDKIRYLLARRDLYKGRGAVTRVLVVEDSKVQRTVIRRMFEAAGGYEVFEAESAEDAFTSREIIGLDLLVTDIFMPGEGGLAVIRRLRETWPHIRIIAISGGFKDEMLGDKTLAAAGVVGADATLKKPFSPETLFATVNRVLERDESLEEA